MTARRITSVTVPVDGRSLVAFDAYRDRTPLLSVLAPHSSLVITLTLPNRVDAGHVRFARDLAVQAAAYATEVERAFRGVACRTPRLSSPG